MKQLLKPCAVLVVALALLASGAIAPAWATDSEKAEIHLRETGEVLQYSNASKPMRKSLLGASSSFQVQNVRAEQEEGTKFVKIKYDLIASDDSCQFKVSLRLTDDGASVSATTCSGDIGRGVTAGRDKCIVWDAGSDWPAGYSEKFKAEITAEETDIPASWANITVSWGAYGGRDLDICGYWIDQPGTKVGWSWGSGSTSSTYRSRWEGDNTGSGPEYIHVGVNPNDIASGVSNLRYRIHFNYFGSAGSSARATVYVSANGVTKSASSATSTRYGNKASTSDPYLTITFDRYGTPISVE